MAVLWPSTLPQTPLLSGNSLQTLPNRAESFPDQGPFMGRQLTTLTQYLVPWNFILTADQHAAFWAFYWTDLKSGTVKIIATDPFFGDSAEFIFEGEPVTNKVTANLYTLTSTLKRNS